jgi:hypothetical protein
MIDRNRYTPPRRGLWIAGVLAVLAGFVIPMFVTGPASAASTCGTHKKTRVSIVYWTCAIPKRAGLRSVDMAEHFQNNHGSRVQITYQVGVSVAGKPVKWNSPEPAVLNPGNASVVTWAGSCTPGKGVRSALRVKATHTTWGPTAYSKSVKCK